MHDVSSKMGRTTIDFRDHFECKTLAHLLFSQNKDHRNQSRRHHHVVVVDVVTMASSNTALPRVASMIMACNRST